MPRLLTLPLLAVLAVPALCRGHAYEIEFPDLSDTTWQYKLDELDVTLTLKKGGGISYTNNGGTFDKGSWTQKGRTVYIETNDRYWECKVTFEKGEGKAEAWNVTGKRWDLHWTRKR